MLTLKRLSLNLALAVGAGSLLAACGDNLKPAGSIDANVDEVPDAEEEQQPDAADGSPTISGTLAVFDTTLKDPSADAVGGIRGGTIRLSFSDLTMGGGEEVFRAAPGSPINSCLITKFDPTHPPHPRLDAGEITISAPATGTNALLKTVGPCNLQPTFGEPDPYVCISHSAMNGTVAAQDLNALSPGRGAVAYTLALPAVDFGMTTPTEIGGAVRGPAGALPANTVQITTAAPHGYATGQFVTITGTTPASFTTSGSPIQVTGATTFVFQQAGDFELGTGGTASVPTGAIVGSALSINGLSNAAFNSGASAFPIIGQINANTLLVVNPAPADNATQGPEGTAQYAILNGFSPVPAAGRAANFLGGSPARTTPPTTVNAAGLPSSVRIQKAANAVWPAIDETVDVPGEERRPVSITSLTRVDDTVTATVAAHDILVGQVLTVAGVTPDSFNTTSATVTAVTPTSFTYVLAGADAAGTGGTAVKPGGFSLDGGSSLLHVFPTTAAALNFSCDNDTPDPADDTCGDESTTSLRAIIVSGSASKKSVAGLFPFQMPTEVPGTDTWLEWSCAFLLSKSAEMPVEAVQAILDFEPTRIEMQVLFVAGSLLDDGGVNVGALRVFAGHALAGHFTFPQK